MEKIDDLVETILDKIGSMQSELRELKTKVKQLEKCAKKCIASSTKKPRKSKKATKEPELCHLTEPKEVTPEVAEFLNLGEDEKISLIDATQKIIAYIKDNDLQNKDNRMVINLDEQLENIFKDKELTFNNLRENIQLHLVN